MKKVTLNAPPKSSKLLHTYETRSILAKIAYDDESRRKRLHIIHQDYFQHEINDMPIGTDVSVIITSKKPKRTKSQNNYMHVYFTLVAIAHGHGVTMEEVKSWAKGKCLAKGITEVFGNKVRKVKDTSKLTVTEMIEFLARVECECGIPLPDPSPFNLGVSYEEFDRLRAEQREKYSKLIPSQKISG